MDVLDWLLDADPAIRWQAMAAFTDASPGEIAAERARVAAEGWGARLLAEQAADGRWDGGTYRPGWVDESRPMYDAWTATHFSLQQLRDFGLDPEGEAARTAIARVRERVQWDGGRPYFDGETEPCVNGIALAIGAYFGQDASPILETLESGILPDGGWNCWAEYGARASSLHSTICVLEGLLSWEEVHGLPPALVTAKADAEAYLLERRLFRRRSDGSVIDPRFTMLSSPTRWFYDVLWGLDYMRRARPDGEPRCAEAVELLREHRRPDGRWNLENTHEGPTLFEMDDEREGFPSRWVTLRALRVLDWWDRTAA